MAAIRTPRLVLREMETDDFESVHAYASDPDVCRYMSFGPNRPEETRAYIARMIDSRNAEPRSMYSLLVCLPDGVVIGGGGIDGGSEKDKAGLIGYLLRRDCWGQGYATEVANALVRFGFDDLRLPRVWSTCHVANSASAHVMEKVGLLREATLEEVGKDGTTVHESYRYGLSAAEDQARRNPRRW